MFGNGINIQCKPTITLYEKKGKGSLFFNFNASQTFGLRSVSLGTPVVDIVDASLYADQTYGLRELILGDPIIPFGYPTFPEANQTYGLTDFELRSTVINYGPYIVRPNQTYGLLSLSLLTVVKSFGTKQIGPLNQTYGLSSFILA